MRWHLHDDGSFDLITPCGALRGAWPGIDHRPVRAVAVEVAADRIAYRLAGGAVLTLRFAGDALGCAITGLDPAPYWVHPVCDAVVEGFDRLFRQGQGFSGPSGFVQIRRQTHRGSASWSAGEAGSPWTLDSHMLLGLAGQGGTLVAGPLDHRRFVFKADLHNRSIRGSFRNREVHEDIPLCELGFRCERVATGGRLELPDLRFSHGADAFATLRAHAGELARAHAVTPRPPTYHYCSWYHKVHFYSRQDLGEVLDGLAACDPAGAVQTVQIDDGYMTSHGDWLQAKPWLWPGGSMEEPIRAIAAAGRRPGIWVGPYMVGSNSSIVRDHPDWLLRWNDGSLVTEWRDWDGTKGDFEHYVLDTSHPGAMAHIRHVFRTLRGWGVRFWKTDFLEWGFKDSTVVRRHTPGRTAMEYVRELMEAIRADIGPDSHWLACISYFAPMLGLADGMRVGSDVGLQWDGAGGTGNDGTGGGTQNMIEEMSATQYLNRVLWENDPDVVYLRDHHVHHEDGAWQAIACWHGILGGSVNVSDEIHLYPAARRAWFDFLRPGDDGIARLPWFERPHPFRVAVRAYPGGWGVLLLNDARQARYGRCPMPELVGLPRAACFRWGPGQAEAMGELDELAAELPGHRHLLVYVSRDGSPPPAGLGLGG